MTAENGSILIINRCTIRYGDPVADVAGMLTQMGTIDWASCALEIAISSALTFDGLVKVVGNIQAHPCDLLQGQLPSQAMFDDIQIELLFLIRRTHGGDGQVIAVIRKHCHYAERGIGTDKRRSVQKRGCVWMVADPDLGPFFASAEPELSRGRVGGNSPGALSSASLALDHQSRKDPGRWGVTRTKFG